MNNLHFNFPANMEDGRVYSNWQPTAVINEDIRRKENIKSNWDYRSYLQQNASHIISYNHTEACAQSGCPTTYSKLKINTDSDLKNTYLSRQTLHKQMYGFKIHLDK